MAKRKNVGTSWHTRAKHALMRDFIGQEVRAANQLDYFDRLAWIDLTAGDGAEAYDAPWHTACSPGILAFHAATSQKPIMIHLYEKNPATYRELLGNLTEQLPPLGYVKTAESENEWRIGVKIRLVAFNGDGRAATIDHIGDWGCKDAVFVLNDPNAITEWAMRSTFSHEIDARAKGLRIMSTLGCNVCGIKRAPFEKAATQPLVDDAELMSLTERRNWFRLVETQEQSLPRRHELLLTSFERDSSQWAYLLSTPGKWLEETEAKVRAAFSANDVGRSAAMAWLRSDKDGFERTKERLFITKTELHERDNPSLPFAGQRKEGGLAQADRIAATANT